MTDPLISIIMPTYKAEDTIERAVASVIRQTWARFELVLAVDDGADYLRLLGDTGIDDPRIKIAPTHGVGTGDWNARNTGLAAATGDFVTLLDSDDAYAPERLEHMLPLAQADGAALDDTTLFLEDKILANLLHPHEQADGEKIAASAALILRDRVPVFPMWRRDLADFTWRQLPHASDVVFSLEVLSAAPALRITPYAGYLYYKRPGSMTLSDSMTARSRAAYHQIIEGIVTGAYALCPEVSDLALYEIAKNLNQAAPFGRALNDDPQLTHEICARAFNAKTMTEAERYAFFTGDKAP
jgi:glycosyltransferase involved in cell wall biosynthesis